MRLHKVEIWGGGALLLVLSMCGVTPVEAEEADPCAGDYERIILDDQRYSGAKSKIEAMREIEGRCARTTGQWEFRMAYLFMQAGDPNTAAGLLQQGLDEGSGYRRELALGLGGLAVARGNFDEAERRYQALMDAFPDWYMSYRSLGVLRLDQGRFREAVALLEHANTLEKSFFAYRCLAVAHNQLDEHEAAVRAINIAFELDESGLNDSLAIFAAVFSYAAIGKLEVAKNLLAMMLKANPEIRNHPDYPRVLKYLARQEEAQKP